MNWIEQEIVNKKLKEINKNFFELGKELYELKENGKLNYEEIKNKYGLSKQKINEYIENYLFIKENDIQNYAELGIKKISLLKKIEDKNIVKFLAEKNSSEEEILSFIPNKKERRIFKKCFNMNEIEIELFNEIKTELEKEFGTKITNSQTLSYIISYFHINYLNKT